MRAVIEFTSNLFVIPILLLALATISIAAPAIGIKTTNHRFASIDGLRGFLAMFVFIHHSSIWYYFARIHKWSVIPSNLFNQFGSTSVALFFMITSFLFFSKLIDGRRRDFDWIKLYVGRIMRIAPLYMVAVFIVFLVVGFVTHFTPHETFGSLMIQLGQWIMIMAPDVNQLDDTKYIICNVQWSLAYEWMFYCSLALVGWVSFRLKPSGILVFSATVFLIIFAVIIYKYYPNRIWWRLCPFFSGLLAVFFTRNHWTRKLFSRFWMTPVLLALGYFAATNYRSIFAPAPMLCITILFVGIACGNKLFGLLIWKPCLRLGQISYSIYLLHGLVLFAGFYFVLGFDRAAGFSILQHWLTICVCTILIILMCSYTYYYIERPGNDAAPYITKRIRRLFRADRSSELQLRNEIETALDSKRTSS